MMRALVADEGEVTFRPATPGTAPLEVSDVRSGG
jgi:hypothetical protein